MLRKTFGLVLLVSLMLSACAPQATEPAVATATQTQPPTATQALATETPTATQDASAITATVEVTATPPPQATRPPNDPNCTNSASFVADITIPDNTNITTGAPFTKTWRISNTGTCIWASDYTLTHYSEERMNAPASVPLPLTYPGQTADISVNLTAPTATGSRRANFVIKNPMGLIMKINDDSRLWLIINVVQDTAAATAAPTATSGATTTTAVTPTAANLTTSTCAFSSEPAIITDTLNAINAYRTQNGLPPYNNNSQLAKAAQSHANDMACNNLSGHTGSDTSTVQSRVTASGYVYSFVAENVYGSNPPLAAAGVVNFWKEDKTDLRNNLNMVSDTYIDIGVGYSFFNGYGYFVVVFGTS